MYRSWAGPKREAGLVLYCPTVHAFIHWNHTLILTNALSSIHTVSACHKENNLVMFIPISIANLLMRFQQHYHFREVWMQQAFNMLICSQHSDKSKYANYPFVSVIWLPLSNLSSVDLDFSVEVSLIISLEIQIESCHVSPFFHWNRYEMKLKSVWI